MTLLRTKNTAVATSSRPSERKSGWRGLLLAAPGVGTALLPKLTCPLCWPAYTAALGAMGVSVASYGPYLFWTTLVLIGVGVGSLAHHAKRRRGYRPLLLGVFAGALIITAKFAFSSDPATYAGAVLLLGAALWHGWPIKEAPPCCACARSESGAAAVLPRPTPDFP